MFGVAHDHAESVGVCDLEKQLDNCQSLEFISEISPD
jgi:hypothetical protein